jgi:hypothetical protein
MATDADRVGIGTTNPTAKLHVVGDAYISDKLTVGSPIHIGNIGYPGNFDAVSICGTGTYDELTPEAKLEIVAESPRDFLMLSSTPSANGDKLIVKNNGNVGVGTTTPDYKLDVRGNRIQLKEDGTNDWIAMRTDGTELDILFQGGNLFLQSATNGEHIFLNPNNTNSNVGIGTTSPPTKLAVMGLTQASYNTLQYNPTTGGIYYVVSSARYKENIQPLQDDFSKILQAEPKSFVYKSTGQKAIGYIAEEFDALGLNNLVTYNNDGQPDGIKYEMVSLYLLEVLKDQVGVIKELKAENQELRQRIERIEGR